MTTPGSPPETDRPTMLAEARAIVDTLRDVLADQGITLPTLRVDPLWHSSSYERGAPLIELGRVSVTVASRLAEALRDLPSSQPAPGR
ncbi:hypothetical protein AB0J21_01895 [Streptomyces sp. NPDC049954]|uniref:hypothetical protein n=1 Tax=Streptomyces sp. NPDC049954 TaxID=3155779 RepID=UPI003415CAAC